METLSDVPLGLFLSGGVDSSLIAYYLKNHAEVETYTVGTKSLLDESKIALQVSNYVGLKSHIRVLEGDDVANKFDDWMFYNDDPVYVNQTKKKKKKKKTERAAKKTNRRSRPCCGACRITIRCPGAADHQVREPHLLPAWRSAKGCRRKEQETILSRDLPFP